MPKVLLKSHFATGGRILTPGSVVEVSDADLAASPWLGEVVPEEPPAPAQEAVMPPAAEPIPSVSAPKRGSRKGDSGR